MNNSSRLDIPLSAQVRYWNQWNEQHREAKQDTPSQRQAALVERWLEGRTGLRLLDAGCGTGWMSERLLRYGQVTGTDLADEVIARARTRVPRAQFVAGDFMEIDLPGGYDVIVALEFLSHVADQPALIRRFADLLRPGGELMLATQNRPVLERWSLVGPPGPGQIRRWVNSDELVDLLVPHFIIESLTSVVPVGDQGWLRYVNSRKLSRLLGRPWERLREHLLLGHTLMVRARKISPETEEIRPPTVSSQV